MKNLTFIVHADAAEAFADVLRGLPQVAGFTFTQVEDHGVQAERSGELSARDLVVGYARRVRVDLILKDADVDVVLAALRESHIGLVGRATYCVTPVTSGLL